MAMDAEREALEAIYEEDFSASGDVWQVAVGDGCRLTLRLGESYPDTLPFHISVSFTPPNEQLAELLAAELPKLWSPGEGCVYQWVTHLQEALERAEAPEEPRSVPLTLEDAQVVPCTYKSMCLWSILGVFVRWNSVTLTHINSLSPF